MSDEKEAEQNLIRVKADASGVDVAVGKSLPDLLVRLIPTRYRLRRAVDNAITDRILAKLRAGNDLDEAEVAFAENFLSDNAKKFVRLTSIQQRASVLIEERQVPLLEGVPPEDATETKTKTSDDWINKFREDASLVDDELVREVYARVLSEEDRAPGAFSLRTLGVLRYLDREVATAFGLLQKVLLDGHLVPQQSPEQEHVLQKVGLNHATMLMLNDAGLVNSASQSSHTREGELLHFILPGHRRVLAARRTDGSRFTVKLSVHLLTPAGRQLARIAECDPDGDAFTALVAWLRPTLGGAELSVADLPSRNWRGPANRLDWKPLKEAAAQQGVAADGAAPRS